MSPRRPPPDSVHDVKPTTVRFSEAAHAFIEEQAKAQGVHFAQYVREAAMARAWFDIAAGGGKSAAEVARMYRQAREQEPPPRQRKP